VSSSGSPSPGSAAAGAGRPPFRFTVEAVCPQTGARAGRLETPHGTVLTPAFLPVGTRAAVKSLAPEEVRAAGAQIVLANTYHLSLRPGPDVIAALGGLHRFMAWDGPLLTDSGGFQVFSLAHLRRVDDDGVTFRSHLDGSERRLTPERAMELQAALGADLVMAFDECLANPAPYDRACQAMERTHRWAVRCRQAHSRPDQALFGIVQGSTYPDLRRESAQFLRALDLPGYAIGGLSVGESKAELWELAALVAAELPQDRPRYLMGVGSPEDLYTGVACGIDLFDCVLPTRLARNGAVFLSTGRLNLRSGRLRAAAAPLDPACDCYTCRTFSAAYVHHLFKAEELFAYRLATIHNLRFVLRQMAAMRAAILEGRFAALRRQFLDTFAVTDEAVRQEQKERWRAAQRTRPGYLNLGSLQAREG